MKAILILHLMLYSARVLAGDYTCNYEGSQREMNACAIRDYKAADEKLNKAYREKIKQLKPDDQATLVLTQREWIRQRDALCAAQKKGQGTNTTIDFLSCLEDATTSRLAQLTR